MHIYFIIFPVEPGNMNKFSSIGIGVFFYQSDEFQRQFFRLSVSSSVCHIQYSFYITACHRKMEEISLFNCLPALIASQPYEADPNYNKEYSKPLHPVHFLSKKSHA